MLISSLSNRIYLLIVLVVESHVSMDVYFVLISHFFESSFLVTLSKTFPSNFNFDALSLTIMVKSSPLQIFHWNATCTILQSFSLLLSLLMPLLHGSVVRMPLSLTRKQFVYAYIHNVRRNQQHFLLQYVSRKWIDFQVMLTSSLQSSVYCKRVL